MSEPLYIKILYIASSITTLLTCIHQLITYYSRVKCKNKQSTPDHSDEESTILLEKEVVKLPNDWLTFVSYSQNPIPNNIQSIQIKTTIKWIKNTYPKLNWDFNTDYKNYINYTEKELKLLLATATYKGYNRTRDEIIDLLDEHKKNIEHKIKNPNIFMDPLYINTLKNRYI
jgi:hypothetical protein